uniref:Uncharacterized protein n=1 Tax=Globisporangium ultimum (strain ATCC 200006 / CBS 805.95 / DAOM BR144) TaxID=431595 RepID=K3WMT1_GLOUD
MEVPLCRDANEMMRIAIEVAAPSLDAVAAETAAARRRGAMRAQEVEQARRACPFRNGKVKYVTYDQQRL